MHRNAAPRLRALPVRMSPDLREERLAGFARLNRTLPSRHIPIEPGDMFSTGAPGGVAVGKANAAELFLKPGDVVECSIEGVATLRTYIVSPGSAH